MSGQGLESLIPKKGNQYKEKESLERNQNDRNKPAPFPVEENNQSQPQYQPNNPQTEAPIYYPPQQQNQTPFKNESGQDEPKKDIEPEANEAIFQIEVEKIKPNPFQPRKEYNKQDLDELAQSIREVGIIQPLVVSKIEEYNENGTKVHYQLISGERRLRAAKIAGLKTVPAVVRKEEDSNTKLSLALIENLQRSDLNPIETARGFARLQDEFGLTQKEIAVRVGKSRESVSNALRLLNLPVKIQDAISQGKINSSQGRFLLSIKEPERKEEIFQRLLRGGVSTRKLKSYLKKEDNNSNELNQRKNFWEKTIEEKLGIPASIIEKGNEKRLIFRLHNQEEWDRLINRLIGEE